MKKKNDFKKLTKKDLKKLLGGVIINAPKKTNCGSGGPGWCTTMYTDSVAGAGAVNAATVQSATGATAVKPKAGRGGN